MKKLLFSAYSLDLGGIETALVTLLNALVEKYEITLVLEKKQGMFLEELDNRIKIIEYTPNNCKIVFFRKLINLGKRICFSISHKNRYDFAASFATYSKAGSFVARTASLNTGLWVHSNYWIVCNKNKKEMESFFEAVEFRKFKNLVFVSQDSKKDFLNIFPELSDKVKVIHHVINGEKIKEKSMEKIEITKEKIPTFLNVGRQEESSKKLTRLITVIAKLKQEGYSLKVYLIGEGKDTEVYKKLVKDNSLTKEIVFLGAKKNPYPYFKIADYVILTSEYEGYPVVFDEAMVLNVPIITTNVSDAEEIIQGKYGMVCEKNTEMLHKTVKEVLEKQFEIKEIFDVESFNDTILIQLEALIKGE